MRAALLCALFALPAPAEEAVVVASVAPQIAWRKVSFRDRVSPGLAGYDSGALPALSAALEVYPLANRGLPVVSDLGLFGSTSRTARGHSESADGLTSLGTLGHAWDAGARFRLVLAGEERGGVSLRYGSLRWDFNGARPGGVLLPTGTLQYWQPGLDGRVALGPLVVTAQAGYLALAVQDAIGRAFPRSKGAGVEAGLAVSLALPARFEAHLGGRYTRLFYSLRPLPGDPFVAGGALDEYATVEVALAYRR